VRLDETGRLVPGALARRVEMGARTYLAHIEAMDGDPAAAFVVCSGGKRWADGVEADAMARELMLAGVPEEAIVRERCSLTTRENARYTAAVLGRRGLQRATVVTCSWHLRRAAAFFADAGLTVDPVAARDGAPPRWPSRVWRWGRERFLMRV
jgi:uncharacterized SAM-binding protein YcdF (DUF218 family)